MNRSAVPAAFQSQPQFATERQVQFLCDLTDRKDLFKSPGFFDAVNAMDSEEYEAYLKRLKETYPRITKQKASETIEALCALPNKPREVPTVNPPLGQDDQYASVTPGRYAIEREGVVKFYRINKPTEGRWAGYTFVDAQASDEFHPIKHTDTKRTILAAIAEDPTAAMQRYGQELGHCGRCGRTLTDETSRELGIGPVCRSDMGI